MPFFRNSVLGDLGFAAVLFGSFGLLETYCPSLQDHQDLSFASR